MTVETLASLAFVISLLLVTFQVARVVTARLWLDHCLYEALICVAEGQDQTACETNAKKIGQSAPLGTKALKISLRKTGGQWEGELQWQGEWDLQSQRKMRLRLDPRAAML